MICREIKSFDVSLNISLTDANLLIEKGCFFGNIKKSDESFFNEGIIKNASHKITRLYFVEKKLFADIQILSTEFGDILDESLSWFDFHAFVENDSLKHIYALLKNE